MHALSSYLELIWFAAGKYAERETSPGATLCAKWRSYEHPCKKMLRGIFALKNPCWNFESSLSLEIVIEEWHATVLGAADSNRHTKHRDSLFSYHMFSSHMFSCMFREGEGKHSCWGTYRLVSPKRAATRRKVVWHIPLSGGKAL